LGHYLLKNTDEGHWWHTVTSALKSLRQKDLEFKASLDYPGNTASKKKLNMGLLICQQIILYVTIFFGDNMV
jgi:hypothetical protein